jgi:hypothetical protein
MILAFGHKARYGKDTACEAILGYYSGLEKIAQKHGQSFTKVKRVNFADALRKEVTEAITRSGGVKNFMDEYRGSPYNMPDWAQLDSNPDMKDPLLPHGKHPKILQYWGTEFRRAQDPDYWVKKWYEQVKDFKGIVVVGDTRFLNEAEAVKKYGGHTCKVERLNQDGSPFFATDRPKDHISETQLDGYAWDFYIKVVTGHVALVEQQAITLAEYLLSLERK